jgi:hypothetical protein
VCGQSVLPNEFPAVGKNDQDPNARVDQLRALDEVAVQDPEEAATACNPRPFRKRNCGGPHPPGERLPRLLVDREEDEDVAYVYAFAGKAVILRLQVRSESHEHRSLGQRLWPDPVLDMEGIQIDRTGKGHMC